MGPLLFLIYINDFRACLSETGCGHFADDTFVIFNSKTPKTIETVVNFELKSVVKWLRLNKLSLNASKTELIFFRSNKHPLNYNSISIKLNGLKLTPVDFIKYLGMYIDHHLNWNIHIDELCKKLSKANGIISKLRYNAPVDICKRVYYAIFFSHLINGCNLWSLTPRNKDISRIERLQKKCVRIMTFVPFNAHTNPIFQDLELIKVQDVIKSQQLKLVYDFHMNCLPDDLMSLFQLTSDVQTTNLELNSANNNLLYLPPFKTLTYGKKSIRYQCPKLWNHTFRNSTLQISSDRTKDINLNSIKTSQTFKKTLKNHYLYNYSLQ